MVGLLRQMLVCYIFAFALAAPRIRRYKSEFPWGEICLGPRMWAVGPQDLAA